MIYMPKRRLHKKLLATFEQGFATGLEASIAVLQAHMGSVPQSLIDKIRGATHMPTPWQKKTPPTKPGEVPKKPEIMPWDSPCPLAKSDDEEGEPHRIGSRAGCPGCNLHHAKVRAGKRIVDDGRRALPASDNEEAKE